MLKTFEQFTLNEQGIIASLGRKPSVFEWDILKRFYFSGYLYNPIPIMGNITSYGKESLVRVGNKSIVAGLESKGSISSTNAGKAGIAAGAKPSLKYKSSQSKITIGIVDSVPGNFHIEGTETFIFLQDSFSLSNTCSDLITLESLQISVVQPGCLGYLLNSISNQKFGLEIYLQKADQLELFSDPTTHGILVTVKNNFVSKVEKICRKNNQPIQKIGHLKTITFFTLYIRKKNKAHLPMSALNVSEPPQRSLTPVISKHAARDTIKLKKELKNYSNYVLEIWKHVNKMKWNCFIPAKNAEQSIAYLSAKKNIAVCIPDNVHFISDDVKTGSRIVVANATRQLVCKGYKPFGISAIFHGRDFRENNDIWLVQEMFSGVHEASQIMKLDMIQPLVTCDNQNSPNLEICVFGAKVDPLIQISSAFIEEGDFITMLGSHRGELNSSLYLKTILKQKDTSVPSVDLRMDVRLQEAVLQGIQAGLIKSAVNISNGGMAAAFAQSLYQSKTPLGARIHLSRKLRQDEILFGETQGLVIVSIGEGDLMEFERVCMNIGVPSTTIGRVTADDLFKFNDVVKMDVKKLRK